MENKCGDNIIYTTTIPQWKTNNSGMVYAMSKRFRMLGFCGNCSKKLFLGRGVYIGCSMNGKTRACPGAFCSALADIMYTSRNPV
eukprot:1763640-Amphidinium_carterae.1